MYTLGGKGAQRKTMSRITRFAIISVVLGALAAAQETPAPAAPPAPPAPVVKARPSPAPVAVAVAATAAKPAKPSSYLGVDIRDVTHDRMAALKLKGSSAGMSGSTLAAHSGTGAAITHQLMALRVI